MSTAIRRLITDSDVETKLLPPHELTKIVNSLGHAFEPVGENIQKAIDELPDVSPQGGWLPPPEYPTGKYGTIWLPNKMLHINKKLTIPPGSVLAIIGSSNSGVLPQPNIGPTYFGGTVIYSHDPSGQILDVPVYDPGPPPWPSTYLWLRDLELRIENPATLQDVFAVNLDGVVEGGFSHLNINTDVTSEEDPKNVRAGLSVQGGDVSNFLDFYRINIQSFHEFGIVANTSHLSMRDIHVRHIRGAEYPQAYRIRPGTHNYWSHIHAFDIQSAVGTGIGIQLNGYIDDAFTCRQAHFESVEKPFENGTLETPQLLAYFYEPLLDGDVAWCADMNDPTKCKVIHLYYRADNTKKSENQGVGTMASGTNSVDITHSLIQTPTVVLISPRHSELEGYRVTARGPDTFTVEVTNNVTADRDFDWVAWV